MRLNLSQFRAAKPPSWLDLLMRDFAAEYEIRYGEKVKSYCATPTGAKTFVSYLKQAGFKAEYWCLEPLVTKEAYNSSKTIEYLAFGVIFNEDCPHFIELKLKY